MTRHSSRSQRPETTANAAAVTAALLSLLALPSLDAVLTAQNPATAYKKVPHGDAWRDNILTAGRLHADTYSALLDGFDADVERLRERIANERGVKPSEVELQYSQYDSLGSWNQALAAQYYDAGAVFYQNAKLDPQNADYWNRVGDRAVAFYRDAYVLPAGGKVPWYRNFTDGLYQHALRMQEESLNAAKGPKRDAMIAAMEASKSAVILLAKEAAFARDDTPDDTSDPMLSREVAYAMRAMLHAEALGAPRRERLNTLAGDALHHLDVLLPKTPPKDSKEHPYTRPFMVGITARALIEYAERTNDKRVLPALEAAADRLWIRMWDEESRSFLYSNRPFSSEAPSEDDCKPAPDLNLMIAPLFAWVGAKTKNGQVSLRRADKILLGGIEGAYWQGAKQYNQQGWWSFNGIAYRAGILDLQQPTKRKGAKR